MGKILTTFSFLKKESVISSILLILLVISIVISYLVYKQNGILKKELFVAQNEVDVDYKLLPINIYNVQNDSCKILQPDSQKAILYFFSVKCRVCDENKKYWYHIVRRFSKKYRIYTIALDNKSELKPYMDEKPKEMKVYYLKEGMKNKKILRTPTTLIIDKDRVEKKWLGKLNIAKIESL